MKLLVSLVIYITTSWHEKVWLVIAPQQKPNWTQLPVHEPDWTASFQKTSPRQTTAYTLPCSNEENHSYHASMASTVTVTCSSAHRYYPHTHWKRFKRWTSLYSTGYVLVQAWSHVHMVSMYTPPSHGQLMKLSHSEPHSFADVKL